MPIDHFLRAVLSPITRVHNNKGGSGNSGSVNNVNSNVNVDAEKN